MAFIGISTTFSNAAATKGITRGRPLRHPRRWGRLVEVVGSTALFTKRMGSIGGVLPIYNLIDVAENWEQKLSFIL
jgi:hypothetical protein